MKKKNLFTKGIFLFIVVGILLFIFCQGVSAQVPGDIKEIRIRYPTYPRSSEVIEAGKTLFMTVNFDVRVYGYRVLPEDIMVKFHLRSPTRKIDRVVREWKAMLYEKSTGSTTTLYDGVCTVGWIIPENAEGGKYTYWIILTKRDGTRLTGWSIPGYFQVTAKEEEDPYVDTLYARASIIKLASSGVGNRRATLWAKIQCHGIGTLGRTDEVWFWMKCNGQRMGNNGWLGYTTLDRGWMDSGLLHPGEQRWYSLQVNVPKGDCTYWAKVYERYSGGYRKLSEWSYGKTFMVS